ncbi:hypothetical protein [Natranaeroarchaeum aerophilus]|uniref:Uncharacterized protein n=1 Tax=Natranaeroarchaeum aerophilus TaxID=2917711 RepID=A0AAE3FMT7_9EURY|nr:hypothetical protein [Natranaeroarchaeum aerophilus]MCL9812512.1 hypothetical protein [Natranaeroarchaeum aerophilus]
MTETDNTLLLGSTSIVGEIEPGSFADRSIWISVGALSALTGTALAAGGLL